MTTERPPKPNDGLVVRRSVSKDWPSILELARRSLGWQGGEEDSRFAHWKHLENPFGVSLMWVALDDERVVGFRAFLRWQFRASDDSGVSAVRAVDTATDPGYRGRGVFTRLTLGAIDDLQASGVDLIFNTPNQRSLPGYLKMGWSVVGRLPATVKLTRLRSLPAIARARRAADRRSIDTQVGERAVDVFSDRDAIGRLLLARSRSHGLATRHGPESLSWRYGFEPLCYRVLLVESSPADGLAVFRVRRRGSAIEAVICDVVIPNTERHIASALVREVTRLTGADYAIMFCRRLLSPGPFVRLPGVGPILTARRLNGSPLPPLREWDLTLGDIELL